MDKKEKLQKLKKEVQKLEKELREEELKVYLNTLIKKAKSMKGKYYIRNLLGNYDEALLYQIEDFVTTGFPWEKDSWIEFKVGHVIAIRKPKPEGYGKNYGITYNNGLVLVHRIPKGRVLKVGEIISDYAQNCEYGSPDYEITELGSLMYNEKKVFSIEEAIKTIEDYTKHIKEVSKEFYDDAMEIVRLNQQKTLEFVAKHFF